MTPLFFSVLGLFGGTALASLGLLRFVQAEADAPAVLMVGLGVAAVVVSALKFHAARTDAPPASPRRRWEAGPLRAVEMDVSAPGARGERERR